MANILITALGTQNSTFIANYLKEQGHFIVGVDIYPKNYIQATKEIDVFYQTHSVYEMSEYLEELFNICKEEKIEYLIPIIDEEVYELSKNKNKFATVNTKICCAEESTIKVCRDKFLTFETIKNAIPEIYVNTEKLSNSTVVKNYPTFIKPSSGRASTGCEKINNEKAFEYALYKTKGEDFIIQEYIEGEVITVDFIHSAKYDKFNCIARKELVRNKNGCGVVVEIIKEKSLEEITHKLVKLINFNGVGNAEFIQTNNGYKLIEINPRFSAGTQYSVMAGADLINDEINIINNTNKDFNYNIRYGAIFTRRYETYEY